MPPYIGETPSLSCYQCILLGSERQSMGGQSFLSKQKSDSRDENGTPIQATNNQSKTGLIRPNMVTVSFNLSFQQLRIILIFK